VRPVRLPAKVPVPEPFVVFESITVGFAEVPQHTPRAVTESPPWAVTLPEQIADVVVIMVISPVVTVGILISGVVLSFGLQENITKAVSRSVTVCFIFD